MLESKFMGDRGEIMGNEKGLTFGYFGYINYGFIYLVR